MARKKCDYSVCTVYYKPVYGTDVCCQSCRYAAGCPEVCHDLHGYCETRQIRRRMRRLVFAAFYIFVFVIIGLIAFTAIAHPFDVLRAEAAAPAAVPVYKETAATWPIVAAQGTGDKEKSKKKEAPIRKQVRKTVTMKGTWYTGDKLGTVGAGGKLKSGETLALNNSQRRALKIQYGGRVYIKAPRKYRLTGYWTVMDTGCRKGIADFYYSSRSRVPAKFRRDGVVKVKVVVIRRAYQ